MSRSIFIAAALALAVTLPAVSAQAQAPRTFVSAAGSDSNPCSFAAPCRHFQAAVNATSAGGEVDALDPAGYGPITISQAITIEGQGWSYIAPPAGGNGITINAVSGNVSVHGVSLNGVGITGTTNGIQFNSGGSLAVADSVIQNFTQNGINFVPSVTALLSVSNTVVSDNAGHGIVMQPSGAFIYDGVFTGVKAFRNSTSGIAIVAPVGGGTLGKTFAAAFDCVAMGTGTFSSSGAGFLSSGNDNAFLRVFHSLASGYRTGVLADRGKVAVSESNLEANRFPWDVGPNSGVLFSYGDNDTTGVAAPSAITKN